MKRYLRYLKYLVKKHLFLLVPLLFIISFIALFIFVFFGPDYPYEFQQSYDQIETIEIAFKDGDYTSYDCPMTVIATIDPSLHQEMTEAISQLPGQRIVPPGTGYGPYVIIITYKDGMQEYVGCDNNGYTTADGKLRKDSYAFETEGFYELLSYYLGYEVEAPTLS